MITTDSVPVAALRHQLETATDSLEQSTSRRVFPFEMTSVRDFITAQTGLPGV